MSPDQAFTKVRFAIYDPETGEEVAEVTQAEMDRLRAIEDAARTLVTDWSDPAFDGATATDRDEFNIHRLRAALTATSPSHEQDHE